MAASLEEISLALIGSLLLTVSYFLKQRNDKLDKLIDKVESLSKEMSSYNTKLLLQVNNCEYRHEHNREATGRVGSELVNTMSKLDDITRRLQVVELKTKRDKETKGNA